MAFSNLEIITNNSTIRNYFRMSYDDMSSMNDFIHKVKMQANFENSQIDSDDIAFFAPAMKTWKKSIHLNGAVRGTVDDLVGKNLLIQAGNNTLLNGDISMTGLPDINQTFIDFKANDFRTTYQDAVAFVPAVKPGNNSQSSPVAIHSIQWKLYRLHQGLCNLWYYSNQPGHCKK